MNVLFFYLISALTTTGKVFSFGENEFGQLGLGDTEPRETPSEVNLQGIKIIAVACGAKHAGVVTSM